MATTTPSTASRSRDFWRTALNPHSMLHALEQATLVGESGGRAFVTPKYYPASQLARLLCLLWGKIPKDDRIIPTETVVRVASTNTAGPAQVAEVCFALTRLYHLAKQTDPIEGWTAGGEKQRLAGGRRYVTRRRVQIASSYAAYSVFRVELIAATSARTADAFSVLRTLSMLDAVLTEAPTTECGQHHRMWVGSDVRRFDQNYPDLDVDDLVRDVFPAPEDGPVFWGPDNKLDDRFRAVMAAPPSDLKAGLAACRAGDYSRTTMGRLADLLMEHGAECEPVLAHLQDPDAEHGPGCWVVDGLVELTRPRVK